MNQRRREIVGGTSRRNLGGAFMDVSKEFAIFIQIRTKKRKIRYSRKASDIKEVGKICGGGKNNERKSSQGKVLGSRKLECQWRGSSLPEVSFRKKSSVRKRRKKEGYRGHGRSKGGRVKRKQKKDREDLVPKRRRR